VYHALLQFKSTCLEPYSETRLQPRPKPRSAPPIENKEVIEVPDSPPRPQTATQVLATQPRSRFSTYDRTGGAEDYRQASITRTKESMGSGGLISMFISIY
jgi:hypothetical protein